MERLIVGQKIKKLRKEHKDTLKSLGEKIEYDWSNLSKVERGVYEASVDLILRISKVYDVSPSEFFGDGFSEPEGKVLTEKSLNPSDLLKKYRFETEDGVEATEEEILEAIKLIRQLKKRLHTD